MPQAAEVNVFYAQIGGHQQFRAGWRPQDGAIIADASNDLSLGWAPGHPANAFDKLSFR
jgi:hypothetical protein